MRHLAVRGHGFLSSTDDVDMNYVKPYHHTLACALSFCQPTMSSSSRAAIRHLVDSRLTNLPPERAKGQEGSAEAQSADHDMNYGKLYHHTLARVSCHLLLSIQHVHHQPGSTAGLLSIVVDPKSSPGKRAERQEGSACPCLLTRALTYPTVNPDRIPLPTSPSVNPSCLHHNGPESGISSTVDVPILPRKEKRVRGVCLQILCLPTLTCTTVNLSMINTDRIPIKHQ
jgi:hypothetical protein